MTVVWERHFASRAQRMRSSDIREAFKLAEDPTVISLAGGFPSPETFQADRVGAEAARLFAEEAQVALQYGPTEGIHELRAWIASYLTSKGMPTDIENVLIAHGSQQALDLLAKLFLNPGDVALVEAPTYVSGLGALGSYEATLHGISVDEDGLRTIELEAYLRERRAAGLPGPKLLYTVPNFQNPTGVTLSADRRRDLVRLAEEYDFFICEDDPYGELRFEGEVLPTVKSFDTQGRVFYLGSFSKIFLPGLRVGWIAAPKEVIAKLTVARQATDLCQNTFGQKLVLRCAQAGLIDGHLEELRQAYRVRRDAMLSAIERHFPACVEWTEPKGGFFVWATMPAGFDAKGMLKQAIAEEKVAYVSGSAFFADGSGKSSMRLAYSQLTTEQIEEGIARLGRFLHRWLETVGEANQVKAESIPA